MCLPHKVLVAILRQHLTVEQAAKLATEIKEFEDTRNRARKRITECQRIRNEADELIASLMSEPVCSHELYETHGDPSGGSDRAYECLICGEWFR